MPASTRFGGRRGYVEERKREREVGTSEGEERKKEGRKGREKKGRRMDGERERDEFRNRTHGLKI